MAQEYSFRTLDDVSLQEIAECFNLAFSDYEQSINFTPESLKYYLTASGVDLSLSFGAFHNEQLVAIILNSSGIYNEEQVVFDAGTGVVPEHRGKKVFSDLFEYTCHQLKQSGVKKFYLEVLQSNQNAVSIYSKKGFEIKREYSVLVASGAKDSWDSRATSVEYQKFDKFLTKYLSEPSYEHTTSNIEKNPELYEVLYLGEQAYCIYAKRNGEIIQVHYNEIDALKEVMTALISRYPSAMAKNIDCSCEDVIQMLKEIGFVEFLKQYEMEREI